MDTIDKSKLKPCIFVFDRPSSPASKRKSEILNTSYPDVGFCFRGTHKLQDSWYVLFVDYSDVHQLSLESFIGKYRPKYVREYIGDVDEKGKQLDPKGLNLKHFISGLLMSKTFESFNHYDFFLQQYEPFKKEEILGRRTVADHFLNIGTYDTLTLGPFAEAHEITYENFGDLPELPEPSSYSPFLASLLRNTLGTTSLEMDVNREFILEMLEKLEVGSNVRSEAILNVIRAQLLKNDELQEIEGGLSTASTSTRGSLPGSVSTPLSVSSDTSLSASVYSYPEEVEGSLSSSVLTESD